MTYPHRAPAHPPPSLPPHPHPNPPHHAPPKITSAIPPPQGPSPVYHHPTNLNHTPAMHVQAHPPNVHPTPPPNPPPGYLMLPIPFPVRPLFNNILNAPDNIGEMRRRFFLLGTPIIQSHYEHEIYWPFMDNFWVRNKVKDSADCRTEYYWCRLFRKQDQKSAVPPELRKRKCSIRSAVGCEMKLRKRFWRDGTVEISNHGTCNQHCHSMDEMDQIKRNSAVRLAIGNEIGKGYRPTEVKRVLLQNREILTAAGGQCITIKDCHNAALVHNKEQKENQTSAKGDDQPEVQENIQDDDEPMLGSVLEDNSRVGPEATKEQSSRLPMEGQLQVAGQDQQEPGGSGAHLAVSTALELTRDINGEPDGQTNQG
ncbi:uncharacterized protein CIMG_08457 [Coccidioides immitis RS]|uniref:Uncharacterized protein n=2 Tax=Coccidioides immitis TaxID=5501 RepID=A0A0E1RWX5_COCIM|nr:uncharacterized protein CIMG_08457 [Coccidioides immitis RS]EAS29711.2 hypothetical protein CIMG_08457 [Coccidioides immitis RS]KMP06716.1 hypothetical protein CIRG_06397 [Coccidioides immitis RMSCC 2394]TPX22385.1 hypothetical protein DIZ76_014257 [Coccidioides immitis]